MSIHLGHFELREQIGKGGMAAVFRAYDPSLDREVAIKLLDEDLVQQDPHYVENFIQEAKCAAAISHPNIVQIYFVGEEHGNYYIAMELLKGKPLDVVIQENGPLCEEHVLGIGREIASALMAAYANEMIHGDVKPQNIFITENGTAKLLDFGLAKMANIEVELEADGCVWGSAYYISPERIGRKAEDFRSDIYSLGATLFHSLVGTPPFDADTSQELAAKRLSVVPPPLRSINPRISQKTEKIVARMLNKNAFLRYLDYDALIADFADAYSQAAGSSTPHLGPVAPVTKPGRLPLIIASCVGVTLLGVAIPLLGKKSVPVQGAPAKSNETAEVGAQSKKLKNPLPVEHVFTVDNGAFPWYDKVNVWALDAVPPSFKGNGPLPQQSCANHTVLVPGKPKAVFIGVHEKELANFELAYPTARQSMAHLAVKNKAGLSVKYRVIKLSNPPPKIEAPGNVEGLLLLKIANE